MFALQNDVAQPSDFSLRLFQTVDFGLTWSCRNYVNFLIISILILISCYTHTLMPKTQQLAHQKAIHHIKNSDNIIGLEHSKETVISLT